MADLFCDPSLFGEFEKTCDKTEITGKSKAKVVSQFENSISLGGQGFNDFKESLFVRESSTPPSSGEHNRNDMSTNGYIKSLQEEIQKLKHLNERFQHQSRVCDIERLKSSLSCPVVQVLFLDKAFARNYQSRIENYLKSLIDEFRDGDERHNLPQINVKAFGKCHYFKDFIFDVTGWHLLDFNQSPNDGYGHPRYEQVFRQSLPCENLENTEISSIKEKRAKATCFNCGGEHNVTYCTKKKDQQRINAARRQFTVNVSSKQRYHIEDDPRFSEMKPGAIGNNLRQALGINSTQLPPYIYQMRIVGYPPGHLENAKRRFSGLTMFDKNGLELTSGGDLLEDGEVNDEMHNSIDYSFDKIVKYPGFNVALPPGTVDEYEALGMPPMQQEPHRDLMKTQLFAEMVNYKRSADEVNSACSTKKHQKTDLESETTVDMDIDDTGGPEDQNFQVWSSMHKVSGQFAADSLPPLPSEQELPLSPLPSNSNPYVQSDLSHENEGISKSESYKGNSAMLTQEVTPTMRGRFGESQSFCLGTPVLLPEIEHLNSCLSLPDANKFANGVSELIMHDNLPNTTGTFKKLKLVLTEQKCHLSSGSCNAPLNN